MDYESCRNATRFWPHSVPMSEKRAKQKIVTHSRWTLHRVSRELTIMKETKKPESGFCIYINTICQGPIPIQRGENGFPFVYPTLLEAQREIADDTMERLRQFLEGERDFEDAVTVEEYIVEVDVLSDGSIVDESGRWFGNDQ